MGTKAAGMRLRWGLSQQGCRQGRCIASHHAQTPVHRIHQVQTPRFEHGAVSFGAIRRDLPQDLSPCSSQRRVDISRSVVIRLVGGDTIPAYDAAVNKVSDSDQPTRVRYGSQEGRCF